MQAEISVSERIDPMPSSSQTDGTIPAVLDLSQDYRPGMPAVAPHGVPDFSSVVHDLNGTPFTIGRVSMSVHTGTHIDAPRHALPAGKTLDAYPLERFMGPAVVLDVRREGPLPLTADELARAKPPIREGDIVLLVFGYAERFGTDEYRRLHPYLADDAAEFLVDMRVPFVGLDLQTPDRPAAERGPRFNFPAHRILLGGDCLIVENLGPEVERLVGRRVRVTAVPLSLPDADGSPVRVWADTTSLDG